MRQGWRYLTAAALVGLAGCSSATAPTTSGTPAGPVRAAPTLGLLTGNFAHGAGFGQVKPKEVFNGGDPTGLVTSITWRSWGGAQAIGTGRSDYVGPNQSVAGGTLESVRIVAFDLGTCNGRYMYAAVEWYFPQHGGTFSARQFEDACIGAYYPPTTGRYGEITGPDRYVLTLSGTPGSLGGSVSQIAGKTLRLLFSFHGHAGIDGSLALVSSGPFQPGRTFTGSWQVLGATLADCDSYLKSAGGLKPSCAFYWGTVPSGL